MAEAVAQAIATDEVLVAEAGTGTGKTFAYLVPALLSGTTVLVSTGTRNLQDQLFHRDLPAVCRALGIQPRVALLKGRANYVCLYHLRRNLAEGRFERREDSAVLRRIDQFARVSSTGDRAQAPGIAEDSPVWQRATSTQDNCLGQECPDLAQCFLFRARQAAQTADVLIVNHHLFCADLALRDEGISELLPSVRALIFDEAHQLPDIATQFFGRAISTRQITEFARDLLRAGLEEAADAADWRMISGTLDNEARGLRACLEGVGRRDGDRLSADPLFGAALQSLCSGLTHVGAVVDQAAERGREMARLSMRAADLAARLMRWRSAVFSISDRGGAASPIEMGESAGTEAPGQAGFAASDRGSPQDKSRPPLTDEAAIHWAELTANALVLHSTPLSLADTFRRHLESTPRAWIFASATLAVNGRFEHFTKPLGLEQARCERWDSPFNFEQQAMVWVPDDCGDPGAPMYADRVAETAVAAVRANRGRAFLLCTSLRMVDQLASRLERWLKQLPHSDPAASIELLIQGSASRTALVERFRKSVAPVLIGSASFWEGVDVVGEQLSLVLIDKLPFAPPDDPVLRARSESLRRSGGDPFSELQLPAAALLLKQGAGRLIRSETDRGLIVICDERIVRRSYGRVLLKSLPSMRMTRSKDEALSWLGQAAGTGSAENLPPASPRLGLGGLG
jgi:ATP-dependent DNA helicase DinG